MYLLPVVVSALSSGWFGEGGECGIASKQAPVKIWLQVWGSTCRKAAEEKARYVISGLISRLGQALHCSLLSPELGPATYLWQCQREEGVRGSCDAEPCHLEVAQRLDACQVCKRLLCDKVLEAKAHGVSAWLQGCGAMEHGDTASHTGGDQVAQELLIQPRAARCRCSVKQDEAEPPGTSGLRTPMMCKCIVHRKPPDHR